ncbi:MAG: DUF3108 domain-containing protein [Gammaproteobacteria bacterium]
MRLRTWIHRDGYRGLGRIIEIKPGQTEKAGRPRMQAALCACLLIAGCAGAWFAAAEQTPLRPRPFSVSYTLYYGDSLPVGQITRALSEQGPGRYLFRSETKATGLASLLRNDRIVEESLWRPAGHGLRPLSYSYDYAGHRGKKHERLRFDWKRNLVHRKSHDGNSVTPIIPGLLDKVLYQLALIYDLQRGKRALAYPVVDGKKVKTYKFREAGAEKLRTALGDFTAMKLERRKDSGEIKTILWCVKELDYVAVRVDNWDDGRLISARIDTLSGIGGRKLTRN